MQASTRRTITTSLRRAMRELYKPGPAMFCGDEDNGEFGAWLVLSALGLDVDVEGHSNTRTTRERQQMRTCRRSRRRRQLSQNFHPPRKREWAYLWGNNRSDNWRK